MADIHLYGASSALLTTFRELVTAKNRLVTLADSCRSEGDRREVVKLGLLSTAVISLIQEIGWFEVPKKTIHFLLKSLFELGVHDGVDWTKIEDVSLCCECIDISIKMGNASDFLFDSLCKIEGISELIKYD